MAEQKNNALRTIVFFLVAVPVIAWLVMFSIKKNNESSDRAALCQEECVKGGHSGYEFKWNILSGPVCQCIQ